MSDIYSEQVASHAPIHSDAYKWEESNDGLPPFKEILLNGEIEEDKIYFIEDLSGESELFQKLLLEIENRIERLEELIEEAKQMEINNQEDEG